MPIGDAAGPRAPWKLFNPREEFGKALALLGRAHNDCMVLTADLARTCSVLSFRDAYPHRFFNVGICEQNMVGIAAGLAFEGKVPVVTSICPFIYLRACEQIRTDVCYNELHVIFVSIMSGLSGAPLGATHYGTEDIAVMRAFPHMTVLQPSGAEQLRVALEEAYDVPGPTYIRLGSGQEPDVPFPKKEKLRGRARRLREGRDVSILATGYMVHKALEAAAILENRGIAAAVWDHPSVKPLDTESVLAAAAGEGFAPKLVVTIEEHNSRGGFGGAVAEILAMIRRPAALRLLGIPDVFAGIGSREELLRLYRLDSNSIAEEIARDLSM